MKFELRKLDPGRFIVFRGQAMLCEEVLRDPDSEGWLTRLWGSDGNVSYTHYTTFERARDAAIKHAEARFWGT